VKFSDYQRALELLGRRRRNHGLNAQALRLSDRIRKQGRRWLRDVNIIGMGIGHRSTAGKDTGELALRVHVLRKLPNARLDRNRIPPIIEIPGLKGPILVDVVQSDVARAQLALVGDGLSLAGVDIFGTIGCVMQRSGSADAFVVTCGHVLPGRAGEVVEWLEFPPATAFPNPRIGTLTPFRSFLKAGDDFPNETDIALVRLDPNKLSPVIRFIGPIKNVRTSPLEVGEPVRLCGFGTSRSNLASRGVCEGTVKEPVSLQVINIENVGDRGFRNMVLCSGFTHPGDSGASVLDGDGRLVGIHVAGSDPDTESGEGKSIFQPIAAVLREFSLSVAPGAKSAADVVLTHAEGSAQGRPPPAVGDRALAIDTLARTLFGEARGEIPEGQRAVANVILNRVAKNKPVRFGGTVEDVCRKRQQFSCWNPGDPNRAKLLAATDANPKFRDCLEIARIAVNGSLGDNTLGSDHYHTAGVAPLWSRGHVPAVVIGSHRFFNDIP
jgi:N-acetylmuramoyl-L-alanine amidase